MSLPRDFKLALILGLITLGIYTSYDLFLGLLLLGIVANDDELMLPVLVVGPICETAFVLFPGFTFSALLSLFLILKAITYALRQKKFSHIPALLGVLLVLAMSFAFNWLSAPIRGLDKASIAQITGSLGKVLTFWAVFQLVTRPTFNWSRYWLNQQTIGFVILCAVYTHVLYNSTIFNWYNQVDRIGYQGADLNEFSICSIALLPLILGKKNVHLVSWLGFASVILISLLLFKTVSLSATIIFCLFLLFHSFHEKSFQLLLAFGGFLVIIFFSEVVDNLSQTSIGVRSAFLSGGGTEKDITTGRLTLWAGALRGLWEYPLLGVGPGANSEASLNQLHSGMRLVTHNTILQFFVSFGLMGAGCLLIALLKMKNFIFRFSHYAIVASLGILLAGSMSLSWLWKDILWILLGIHIGYNYVEHLANNSHIK